jgi:UDP-3-O-[3-hydroxymyristoyl] N-acetylglucosamine deacetylase
MISTSNGRQTTIARPVVLAGIGVHSGAAVKASLLPGDPDSGIIFRRDVDGSVREIRAISANLVSTDLCTAIGTAGGVMVGTIEHIMAAVSALGIDNLVVELDGPEMPIMDGSATAFVEAIDSVGLFDLGLKRRYLRVLKPVRVEMGGSWGEFVPYDGRRYEVDIDFDSPLIGRQAWKGDLDARTFRSELARARTFGFMRDVERLWSAGYALGASLDNAVVVGDDDKVINAEGLRFADEFARHKALDAVGDLALAGMPFIGMFRSYRGGHKLNAVALKALIDDASAYEIVEAAEKGGRSQYSGLVAVSAPAAAPWSQ